MIGHNASDAAVDEVLAKFERQLQIRAGYGWFSWK